MKEKDKYRWTLLNEVSHHIFSLSRILVKSKLSYMESRTLKSKVKASADLKLSTMNKRKSKSRKKLSMKWYPSRWKNQAFWQFEKIYKSNTLTSIKMKTKNMNRSKSMSKRYSNNQNLVVCNQLQSQNL